MRDRQRREHARIDTPSRQQKVDMTREWIFEKGYGVKSAAVERVLGPESLVPTRVTNNIFHRTSLNLANLDFLRTYFLLDFSHSVSIFFHCSFRIYFMNLS